MACSKEEHKNDDNLETFSIWWLDKEVHNKENREAQKQLRSIINDLKTWQCPKEFVRSVLRMSQDDRVVIIVSGGMGREVLPHIDPLRQVSSVYVYCANKKANEHLAQDYRKVLGVFVQLDELISQIHLNHKYSMKKEEPLSISVFKVDGNAYKTLTGINGQFLNFQLLIEILVRMKSNKTDREEFMSMCKEKYKDNGKYLNDAKEFYTSYAPEKAVWWYTRDTFIFEVLNKALRTQNFDVLVHFHGLVNDIRQQLNRNQYRQPITVYRGQHMSNSELSSYQNLIGQFISTNSFFSTSLNEQQAIGFAHDRNGNHSTKKSSDNGLKRVLFEINADPRKVTTNNRPFANISSFSYFPKEEEVLFMVGSIFRLHSIDLDCLQNDGRLLSTIRMTLCGDEQHELHELYRCMRKDYGNDETDLRSLGTLLVKMEKYDLAKKYYDKMLAQVSPNDPKLGDLYHSLGFVAAEKGENDTSLNWYKKSIAFKMQNRPSDYVSICQTYNNIGIVLQKKGDVIQALEYYNKAVSLFQQAHDENHLYMGALYHCIGFIHQEQHNYLKALEFYERSIGIKQKHLPSNHPDFAISYNAIGHVRHRLGHHDIALQFYKRSLEINRNALPPEHTDIAMNYTNIGLLYGEKGEFQLSLENLKSAKKIYRYSLPSHSSEVVNVKKAIEFVSEKFQKKSGHK